MTPAKKENRLEADPRVALVYCNKSFTQATQNKSFEAVIHEGYVLDSELINFLDGLGYNDIRQLCPIGGEIGFAPKRSDNFTKSLTIDERKKLPEPLKNEILNLAALFHQATQQENIRFTLSNIWNGPLHIHLTTFMTLSFISIGTRWPVGKKTRNAPSRKPFLFKPLFKHGTPFVSRGDSRLVCSFFPTPE